MEVTCLVPIFLVLSLTTHFVHAIVLLWAKQKRALCPYAKQALQRTQERKFGLE